MTPAIQVLMRETERICDEFRDAVFAAGDVEAAMALVAPGVEVHNVPAGTGATGVDAVREYLVGQVVGHVPADLRFTRVTRTVDRLRLADELRVTFTHDRELPWLLPGIAATGRSVDVLAMTVAIARQGRLFAHRTLWDHAGLLGALGLSPMGVPHAVGGLG